MLGDLILVLFSLSVVTLLVGLPIAGAIVGRIGRRTDRRGAELMQRLQAIEQTLDSVAAEVERMSEAQRFTARVLTERNARGGSTVPAVSPSHALR